MINETSLPKGARRVVLELPRVNRDGAYLLARAAKCDKYFAVSPTRSLVTRGWVTSVGVRLNEGPYMVRCLDNITQGNGWLTSATSVPLLVQTLLKTYWTVYRFNQSNSMMRWVMNTPYSGDEVPLPVYLEAPEEPENQGIRAVEAVDTNRYYGVAPDHGSFGPDKAFITRTPGGADDERPFYMAGTKSVTRGSYWGNTRSPSLEESVRQTLVEGHTVFEFETRDDLFTWLAIE